MPTGDRIQTVVVGAGHAGLATSFHLSQHGIEHVILERGEVANTWKNERWDSFRLLTPNRLAALPDQPYQGPDPDGFMSGDEVVDLIGTYATRIGAPVANGVEVRSLRESPDGFEVVTEDQVWDARAVVLATGAFNLPRRPAAAERLPADVASVTAFDYKNPEQLPEGRVLVVGASATGVQLAREIRGSGREVMISTGEHVRMPRHYRGRDIFWWLDAIGRHSETIDDVDDLIRARSTPSPQLEGSGNRPILDLNALRAQGVQIVGRLGEISEGRAYFSGSLRNVCALADLKLSRLLDTIDEWVADADRDHEFERPERLPATEVDDDPPLVIDLHDAGIASVVWATGFRPDYSWLDVPVIDRRGEIRHDGGVVRDAPGLYRIGLNFLRKRKSSFIYGADEDSSELVAHLARFVGASRAPSLSTQR